VTDLVVTREPASASKGRSVVIEPDFFLEPVVRPFSSKLVAISALMILTCALSARAGEKTSEYNLESGKVGIKGHDPVSYFAPGGPKEGHKKITSTYKGVV